MRKVIATFAAMCCACGLHLSPAENSLINQSAALACVFAQMELPDSSAQKAAEFCQVLPLLPEVEKLFAGSAAAKRLRK